MVAQCQPTPPACCDEVAITIDTQPLPCLPVGGGTVSVQFSATLSPAGCTGPFEWQVKDATTTPNTVIQPFTLGSSVFSYPFAKAGMYRVNVKVQQAITCDDPVLTHSVNVPIVQCITPTPCAVGVLGPQQTPCTDGAPTPLQTYTATTTTPFAGPYTWEVLKSPASLPFYQTQGGVSFPFAFPGPGTYTVTVSIQTQGCTNPTAGSSIIVTVPPCTPPCPPGQQRDTSGNCVPIPCPPGQSRDSSGNCVTPSRIGCDALLWISLILILISGVLGVIACIVSVAVPPPPGPIVAAVLGIIAAALLIIGLLLFLLWWAICRFFTACSVIIGAINFMGVLIAIFAIVAIVLFILGKFGVPVGVCWVSAAANSALWGLLLFILYRIAVAVRCITENSGGPPPPSPPSSSSSALSSSDVLRNRERTSFGDSSYRMER